MDIGGPDPGRFTPLPGRPPGFLGSLVTRACIGNAAVMAAQRGPRSRPRWSPCT